MGEADALKLRREPESIYDPNAIAVLWKERRIGFVPREHAQTLSSIMDHGFKLRATVDYAASGVVFMDVWMCQEASTKSCQTHKA